MSLNLHAVALAPPLAPDLPPGWLDELDLAPGARVVVAMSGGVDSSVTAALLAEAGFEVVGITLQLYDHGAAVGKKGACCAGQDIHDARAVAEAIGVPHYVIDTERRFKQAVIEEFAADYARGRTPVPCVRCNERVKFQDLLRTAKDLGAAALATGHYARRLPNGALAKAADPAKDQSYFLLKTTADQLGYLRFPLGPLTKAQTRQQAARLDLPVAAKPESQDICFVPDGDHSKLVGKLARAAAEPGPIVHADGRQLGQHRGIGAYTVGQRRGLGVSASERLYVTAIDAKTHTVLVGPRAAGLVDAATLSEWNWIGDGPSPDETSPPLPVLARYRHNQTEAPATLAFEGATPVVRFAEPQNAVAPGQACCLYGTGDERSRVLGGGWIGDTLRVR